MQAPLIYTFIFLFFTNIPLHAQDPQSSEWFDEAKFGIMVHWGLYTIPAYAPDLRRHGTEAMLAYFLEVFNETLNLKEAVHRTIASEPYAEWYFNAVKFPYETRDFHNRTFGEDFLYKDFEPLFEDSMSLVDPNEWAAYFAAVGAKYLVFVTKHHDGYQLWPSDVVNIRQPEYYSDRDFVGELGEACRAQNMIYGLYYSGGIDVTYKPDRMDINDLIDFITVGTFEAPRGRAYGQYCFDQMRELIDRYKPAVLWNDMGYPELGNAQELYNYYKEAVPYGLVNNRFNGLIPGDFATPEFAENDQPSGRKWESVRGMTNGFGYNRLDDANDVIGKLDLRILFTRIIANGGNLLLNIPITASGIINPEYREVLDEFGPWLETNNEAIFKSKYRIPSSARSSTGEVNNVFFTTRENNTYLFFTDSIQNNEEVSVFDFTNENNLPVSVLGLSADLTLEWDNVGDDLVIRFGELEDLKYPVVVRIGNPLQDTLTSVQEPNAADHRYSVFPNPTSGKLSIDGSAEDLKIIDKIRLMNVSGQVVKEYTGLHDHEIDINGLPDGLYLVELVSRNKILAVHRVVKE